MRARVEWDGKYWVAEPEEGGGATQAKRLELLPQRLTEVFHLMTGRETTCEEWELDIDYSTVAPGLGILRQKHVELERANEALTAETLATIYRLREQGLTFRDIGDLVYLSHQRVHQLVKWGDGIKAGIAQAHRGEVVKGTPDEFARLAARTED